MTVKNLFLFNETIFYIYVCTQILPADEATTYPGEAVPSVTILN